MLEKVRKFNSIKPGRFESREHTEYVWSLPCPVCGRPSAKPHHIIRSGEHGMGKRSGDQWQVPACYEHHQEIHLGNREKGLTGGNEKAWEEYYNIDLKALAKQLAASSPCERTRAQHG